MNRPREDIGKGSAVAAAVAYFGIVFGAGFLLGPLRIFVVEPTLGARWAELAELPVIVVVMVFACRWVVGRWSVARSARPRIAMGLLALGLMLAAEFGLVLSLRGMTIAQYFAARDPVSGTAYYLALGLFALLPWIFLRRSATRPG